MKIQVKNFLLLHYFWVYKFAKILELIVDGGACQENLCWSVEMDSLLVLVPLVCIKMLLHDLFHSLL